MGMVEWPPDLYCTSFVSGRRRRLPIGRLLWLYVVALEVSAVHWRQISRKLGSKPV